MASRIGRAVRRTLNTGFRKPAVSVFSTIHYKLGYAIITLAPILTACSLITVNRTNAKGMDALVGKSFVVVKDSFLIENACIKEYSTERCLQLQVVAGRITHKVNSFFGWSWVGVDLPATIREFEENPLKYNNAYISTTLFGTTRQDIVGIVSKGTTVTITRLVSKALGETGRCWVVYGRLEKTPNNTAIEIPACGFSPEAGPLWFISQRGGGAYYIPPKPDPEYLIRAPKQILDESERERGSHENSACDVLDHKCNGLLIIGAYLTSAMDNL